MMDIQNILYMVSLGSCKSEDIYIRRCSARVSSKGKMGGVLSWAEQMNCGSLKEEDVIETLDRSILPLYYRRRNRWTPSGPETFTSQLSIASSILKFRGRADREE